MITKGLKMWIFTLVEYDEYGQASVVKSFCKPAKDSAVKQKGKASTPKQESKKAEEVNLF